MSLIARLPQYTSILVSSLLLLLLAGCVSQTVSLKDTHVHGLAVDRGDSSRLYIATHHGLLVLQNDGSTKLTTGSELTLVGRSRDDFMGFSPHPSDPNVLFSSGHPKGGGNLGFLKSEDAGVSWKKLSNANLQGPADFHTMMAHPANPDHIYGWYRLRVHRSLDGGRTWEVMAKQPPEALSFAGDPRDENVVYLGTIGDLLMSTDRGETFSGVTDAFENDVVFDIEADPSGSLYLATRDSGIQRVTQRFDGGVIVETVGKIPDNDVPEHLALDPKNAAMMYVFGESHALWKSADGGKKWQKVL